MPLWVITLHKGKDLCLHKGLLRMLEVQGHAAYCFLSLVFQQSSSTTRLKEKPSRDKPLSEVHSTQHQGSLPCTGAGGVSWSLPSASAPALLRQGPHQDTCSHPPVDKGALIERRYLSSLLTLPVASEERFVPPMLMSPSIPSLHLPASWASPSPQSQAQTAVGKGHLGLHWWESALTSPSTVPSLSWVLGSSCGWAKHFPHSDFEASFYHKPPQHVHSNQHFPIWPCSSCSPHSEHRENDRTNVMRVLQRANLSVSLFPMAVPLSPRPCRGKT